MKFGELRIQESGRVEDGCGLEMKPLTDLQVLVGASELHTRLVDSVDLTQLFRFGVLPASFLGCRASSRATPAAERCAWIPASNGTPTPKIPKPPPECMYITLCRLVRHVLNAIADAETYFRTSGNGFPRHIDIATTRAQFGKLCANPRSVAKGTFGICEKREAPDWCPPPPPRFAV